MTVAASPPTRRALVAAFSALYLVWGSSYLAIRFGLEGVPPLTLAAVRSILAGALLYGWGRARGDRPLTLGGWRTALVAGGLLFLVGHGGLFWAIQRVPSGIAALLFSTIPVWMAVLEARAGGVRSMRPRAIVGVAGGIAGVTLLLSPGLLADRPTVDPLGVVVVLCAAFGWAVGSSVAKRTTSSSVATTAGSHLLAGGGLLAVAAVAAGELNLPAWAAEPRPLLALAYLVVFGSVVTLAAYQWLLRRVSLVAVSTYAYVNPVVALLLGWLVAGEPLGPRVLFAAGLVLISVALMMPRRPVARGNFSASLQEGLTP